MEVLYVLESNMTTVFILGLKFVLEVISFNPLLITNGLVDANRNVLTVY